LEITEIKTKTETKTVETFVNNAGYVNKGTARECRKRLKLFAKFVNESNSISLDELVETLTIMGHGPRIDVYQLFSQYIGWLQQRGNMSPRSIKTWVSTARHYLETLDVEISPRKWQLKIKMPRIIRSQKESLTKEDIQTILNACSSIKLKTYLLWLAATGCRATESLSVRLCDINFEVNPATVHLRGEYTKTKTSRTILLTKELTEQLKAWLRYKYRTRSIGYYDKNTRTATNKIIHPVVNPQVFIFSSNLDKNPDLRYLYTGFLMAFEKTLDRLGGKYAEYEDDNGKRRKITLHSFRRFVKGTISDLGLANYSEYYLGHQGSVYWTRSPKEIVELFKKCEPYLTFLNYNALETRSNDLETRNSMLESEVRELRDNMNKIMEMIQENPKLAQVKPEALTKKIT
jgi:integrase